MEEYRQDLAVWWKCELARDDKARACVKHDDPQHNAVSINCIRADIDDQCDSMGDVNDHSG